MAELIRFILGVISTILMIGVVIIIIAIGLFIIIPYIIIMRLMGKKVTFNAQTPFTHFIRNRVIFNKRPSQSSPQPSSVDKQKEEPEPIRYKENHDPDVIDVKATVIEK